MKRLNIILAILSIGISGCVTDGQGVLARALNNSIAPNVDPAFCLTMKDKPIQVFYDFAKQHKLADNGYLTAIGDLYPAVQTYNRGNFRAAIGLKFEGFNAKGDQIWSTRKDIDPIKHIECWMSTSPEPPGRAEYSAVKM